MMYLVSGLLVTIWIEAGKLDQLVPGTDSRSDDREQYY